jgi:5-methylcytosine-specific restriction endonuclease McrA
MLTFKKPKFIRHKRPIVDKIVHSLVLERDKYCQLCGNGNNLQLHHINGRGKYLTNNVSNCIMLCQHCHMEVVHKNNKVYRPLLNEIIERSTNENNNTTSTKIKKE